MIIVKDWIAAIPEEDKHIAFVGEHQSVTRQFLLTGSDWQNYAEWGFHLDMAFDLSTVTKREERKKETTQVNTTENITETQVKTTGSTTKETYVVEEVDIDCAAETDIAYLVKEPTEEGLVLTWTVLRQHTQLPGVLQATIRALGPDGQVKKSTLMVFEVEPAVVAEPAAEIPQSEFEAMEQNMDEMLDAVLRNAQSVETFMNTTEQLQEAALTACVNANQSAIEAKRYANEIKLVADDLHQDRLLMDQVLEICPDANLLDMDQVIFGKGMDKSGAMGSLSEYDIALTGYIPVREGDVVCYQCTNPETGERQYGCLFLVCLFDENRYVTKVDHSYAANENGSLYYITIPEGVSYVRLTLHDLSTSLEPAIVYGSELVPYKPYTSLYTLKKNALNTKDLDDLLQPVRCVAQELTEAEKEQARQNIGALSDRFTVPADTKLDAESYNPVSNMAVTRTLQYDVYPHLLPDVQVSDTYHILRVAMNGEGFEFIPIQKDAYIQNWILPYLLPSVSSSDNGKTMQVVNGEWKLV